MALRFDNRWGPASILSAMALIGTMFFAYTNSTADLQARVVKLETETKAVSKSLDRIEDKLDRVIERAAR